VPGKQKRNGQSRRYRERVRNRKPAAGAIILKIEGKTYRTPLVKGEDNPT
jgi:chaperone required for assembly of F1-ATPase